VERERERVRFAIAPPPDGAPAAGPAGPARAGS
jgi:hypothetical protein